MCMLCHLSAGLKTIGFPLVMGFVRIFVPGTNYITCDELAQKVEESKQEYDNVTSNENLNESEARDLLKKRKFLLLDARRRDEFCVSHIYNATNVHSTFTHGKDDIKVLNDRLEQVCDKDTLLVMYCAVGLRSAWLAKHLTSQGFTNCKVLYHGFYEWTNEGRPIYGQNCTNVIAIPPKNPDNSLEPSEQISSSSSTIDNTNASVSSRKQQEPKELVEASITDICLCQTKPEIVHMCNHSEHGCAQTHRVAPQHFIASLALKQSLSTKYKFPSWLSSHRSPAISPSPSSNDLTSLSSSDVVPSSDVAFPSPDVLPVVGSITEVAPVSLAKGKTEKKEKGKKDKKVSISKSPDQLHYYSHSHAPVGSPVM